MRTSMVLALVFGMISEPLKLTLGDPAPPLAVETYVKGSPVDLGKGLHVVEFWATWCHPCIHAIPHLSDLAHRYHGKVDFTGVSVSEFSKTPEAAVREFVSGMGKKMDYNVAWDGPKKLMAGNWLDAADQPGIPVAFLVKDGVVEWIGDPVDGLQKAIDQNLNGTFDLASEKKAFEKAPNILVKMQIQVEDLQQALQPVVSKQAEGDLSGALTALDDAEQKRPDLKLELEKTRYDLLDRMQSPELVALANRFTHKDFKDSEEDLDYIAWKSVNPKSKKPVENPNYSAALILAKRAAELGGMKHYRSLDVYGYVLYRKGDLEKAKQVGQKAVDAATLDKAPASELKPLTDHLALYATGS